MLRLRGFAILYFVVFLLLLFYCTAVMQLEIAAAVLYKTKYCFRTPSFVVFYLTENDLPVTR